VTASIWQALPVPRSVLELASAGTFEYTGAATLHFQPRVGLHTAPVIPDGGAFFSGDSHRHSHLVPQALDVFPPYSGRIVPQQVQVSPLVSRVEEGSPFALVARGQVTGQIGGRQRRTGKEAQVSEEDE
jgi:hypothetical protein